MRERRGCDEQVVSTDKLSTPLEIRPEPGMDPRDFKREREDRNGCQRGLDESLTATATYGTIGSVDSMKELRRCYRRESDLLIAEALQ